MYIFFRKKSCLWKIFQQNVSNKWLKQYILHYSIYKLKINLTDMDRRFTEAGFTPTGKGDGMRCSSCNLEVGQWGPDDDPMDIHEKHSTQCPFILQKARGTCMNHLCYYHAKTYQMDSFKRFKDYIMKI